MGHKSTARQPDNALCFVQFMHPGPEHRPDDGCFKSWNRDLHRRKFLVSPGRCIRQRKVRNAELVFWGEWEPESEVACRMASPLPQYPRYLYRPYYVVPDSYKGLQNTDPFVFGGFFYGNCRQHSSGRPTRLCSLRCGSVILFGSFVSGKFVLDTVFVLRDSIPYNCASRRSIPKDRVPPGYMEVVLNPLCLSRRSHEEGCPPDNGAPYQLYVGATYDRPVHGIFSFFPCMPRHERCEHFKRPKIKIPLPRFSRPARAYRLYRQMDKSMLRELWQSVVDQVLKEGLWLGIEARMPKRRRAKR